MPRSSNSNINYNNKLKIAGLIFLPTIAVAIEIVRKAVGLVEKYTDVTPKKLEEAISNIGVEQIVIGSGILFFLLGGSFYIGKKVGEIKGRILGIEEGRIIGIEESGAVGIQLLSAGIKLGRQEIEDRINKEASPLEQEQDNVPLVTSLNQDNPSSRAR